ncbi:hypothetical protein PV371_36680 [Streptomyces sp. TX20-6-3]|uniref:hypothetical protein n=1 Tax=Streptomyces sp. TX20-6-3 TaxID=3028705 RepID=UPI0029A3354F|nr:hypothetical protein [Streptomyces sp. TX20-6-3]MDX2565161.1 hypothetical protein [Streptomyces sp. TX20-6-3]
MTLAQITTTDLNGWQYRAISVLDELVKAGLKAERHPLTWTITSNGALRGKVDRYRPGQTDADRRAIFDEWYAGLGTTEPRESKRYPDGTAWTAVFKHPTNRVEVQGSIVLDIPAPFDDEDQEDGLAKDTCGLPVDLTAEDVEWYARPARGRSRLCATCRCGTAAVTPRSCSPPARRAGTGGRCGRPASQPCSSRTAASNAPSGNRPASGSHATCTARTMAVTTSARTDRGKTSLPTCGHLYERAAYDTPGRALRGPCDRDVGRGVGEASALGDVGILTEVWESVFTVRVVEMQALNVR